VQKLWQNFLHNNGAADILLLGFKALCFVPAEKNSHFIEWESSKHIHNHTLLKPVAPLIIRGVEAGGCPSFHPTNSIKALTD